MKRPIFVHAESVPNLTLRENEVATLIIGGDRGPDIAGKLGISSGSVKQYVRAINKKLDVNSRPDIARVVGYYRKAYGEK